MLLLLVVCTLLQSDIANAREPITLGSNVLAPVVNVARLNAQGYEKHSPNPKSSFHGQVHVGMRNRTMNSANRTRKRSRRSDLEAESEKLPHSPNPKSSFHGQVQVGMRNRTINSANRTRKRSRRSDLEAESEKLPDAKLANRRDESAQLEYNGSREMHGAATRTRVAPITLSSNVLAPIVHVAMLNAPNHVGLKTQHSATLKPSLHWQAHVSVHNRTIASANRTSTKAKRSDLAAKSKASTADGTGDGKLAKKTEGSEKLANLRRKSAELERNENRETRGEAAGEHQAFAQRITLFFCAAAVCIVGSCIAVVVALVRDL